MVSVVVVQCERGRFSVTMTINEELEDEDDVPFQETSANERSTIDDWLGLLAASLAGWSCLVGSGECSFDLARNLNLCELNKNCLINRKAPRGGREPASQMDF